MTRYHFNETTGKTALCKASQRKCPLIHGESEDQARKNHEMIMSKKTLVSVKKQFTQEELLLAPIEILCHTPLKDMDTAQLSQTLRYESIALGMDEKVIDSSINLASILHAHQTRRNRGNFTNVPYIEHPLRNAVRLIRLGVEDQDIVVAAVLHDTIEDGAKVFVKKFKNQNGKVDELDARSILSEHIQNAYGNKTLEYVEAVTNDYMADMQLTPEDKRTIYRNHVKANILHNPGVFLVKVSDFIDNATGLYHNDKPGQEKQVSKQARKYLPVVKVFQDAMNNYELPVSENGHQTITRQLDITAQRLKTIVKKYENID